MCRTQTLGEATPDVGRHRPDSLNEGSVALASPRLRTKALRISECRPLWSDSGHVPSKPPESGRFWNDVGRDGVGLGPRRWGRSRGNLDKPLGQRRRNSANTAQHRPNLGRFWAELGQMRASLARSKSELTKSGQRSADVRSISTSFGKPWFAVSSTWGALGRAALGWAALGRLPSNVGQLRPISVHFGMASMKFGPSSTAFGSTSTKFGQIVPSIDEPILDRID